MELTEHQIRLLITSLPRDRNGLPIIPCETYVTTDGVECKPRFLIDFGVSVMQGDRYRQCTPQDVILQANADEKTTPNETTPRICRRCHGMGWVPSMTNADTDPCPRCSLPNS